MYWITEWIVTFYNSSNFRIRIQRWRSITGGTVTTVWVWWMYIDIFRCTRQLTDRFEDAIPVADICYIFACMKNVRYKGKQLIPRNRISCFPLADLILKLRWKILVSQFSHFSLRLMTIWITLLANIQKSKLFMCFNLRKCHPSCKTCQVFIFLNVCYYFTYSSRTLSSYSNKISVTFQLGRLIRKQDLFIRVTSFF